LNYALAALSGILLILVFPHANLALLAPVALAPLLVALGRDPRPWGRFRIGALFGGVAWFGMVYWIQFVLSFHGGIGDAGGWAVFLLFCLAKAAHTGAFGLGAGRVLGYWWAIPGIAALWVTLEYAFTFTFAWLVLGNAGIDMSVPMRLAPYTGVYGLSFVFAMLATALALAILKRPRLELAWLCVLPLLILLPAIPEAPRGRENAVLVQPNISQTQTWTAQSLDQTMQELGALSLKAVLGGGTPRPPSLLVWPEVPAPFYYDEDPAFRDRVNQLARATGAYFLLGTVSHTAERAPLNSALLVSPAGSAISRYDKIKLVPFGEFVPWPLGLVARHISTEVGDFAPGREAVVSPADSHKLGTFICYESAFPHLVRRFVANGAQVLFNISNDGWFGKSAAREQHLRIVRMRAVENQRWILRSTNDGITAGVDPSGRVRTVTEPYVRSATIAAFDYVEPQTFYTRHGDWFALGCVVLSGVLVAVSRDGSPERRRP
jgi:apolipoprotein N-acyltransferase